MNDPRVHYARLFGTAVCGQMGRDVRASIDPRLVNCRKCLARIFKARKRRAR